MTILLDRRRYVIGLCHALFISASLVISFSLRFDFTIPDERISVLRHALWIALVTKMLMFHVTSLDRGWWRYVGVADLLRVFIGNLVGSIAFTGVVLIAIGPPFPRSIYFIDFLLCFLLSTAGRFAVRIYNEAFGVISRPSRKGILIYGAGNAGRTIVREIGSNRAVGYEVIGFIDDNPKKKGATMMGVPVLGSGHEAARIVADCRRGRKLIEEIVIALPSATSQQMGKALAYCRAAGVRCKTLPSIGELLDGKVISSQIRDISVTDLLGREPIRLEEERIRRKLTKRTVLVTGAAGSIGSELCRQIAEFSPLKLIALDQAESDLFKADHELRAKFPGLDLICEIADIRDPQRIDDIVRVHAVNSIFHAAAYKHVPMMEIRPLEAVKNNILGTWNVVQAAARNRVTDFVLISSDKAVNPTNVMGATKRAAELLISSMSGNAHRETKFVSVRFGNVLGSNGSVVPLFKQQIEAGGPVTVTHPEVRRYFMTIREAVQLVLQASTMGKGNETFVLDMGQPVRIVDLASNMIRLAGLVPDKDIQIRFVGLRPGEKLYEELITEGEHILPTHHEKIKIFQGPGRDAASMDLWLLELQEFLAHRDAPGVVNHLKQLIPEYQPAKEWKVAEKAPLAFRMRVGQINPQEARL